MALVGASDDLVIAGESAAVNALSEGSDANADVVLWDLATLADDDLDALGAIAESGPPVVALIGDPSLGERVRRAGARGVLLRETAATQVQAALRAAAADLQVLDPALLDAVVAPDPAHPEDDGLFETLTPRELDVLDLLALGISNKEIAVRLAISEHTVKFHVNAILGKLGAQSRTEAVTLAARRGIIHF
jgi:DNA-binding NarL/FixJ family response regulator